MVVIKSYRAKFIAKFECARGTEIVGGVRREESIEGV